MCIKIYKTLSVESIISWCLELDNFMMNDKKKPCLSAIIEEKVDVHVM